MSGVAVGVAAVGAIGGAVAANQNNKAAEGMFNSQMGLMQQNVNSINAFNQGQQQLYGPLEQQLVQQASSSEPLFFGPMSGQINANFDAGQRNLQTQMAQRGLQGSGLEAGGASGMELGRAGALDTAFQQGLQSRLQLGQAVLSRYQPLLNQSMLSGAYTGQAGVMGQQGQMYAGAAQQGWNQIGSSLGSLGQTLAMRQPSPSPTPDPSQAPNAMGGVGPVNDMTQQMGGASYTPYPTTPNYNFGANAMQPPASGGLMGLPLGDVSGLTADI